jgi:cell division protein FtsI (penicillin-binding protein 3)
LTRPPVHRLVALLAAFLLAFGGIVARLAVLQVHDNPALTRLGLDERVHTFDIPAERGSILDRTGTPLALTLDARDVYADPALVTDPNGEARRIADELGLRWRAVQAVLRSPGTFAYIARQVDLNAATRLEALRLPGIGFLPVAARTYPAGSIAAQVLGFVGVDGNGLAGLEAEYDRRLAGTPGEQTAELSAIGLPIASGMNDVTAPTPGETLVSTIDRQTQYQAQRYLAQAVKSNGAKDGTIVVMDPATGDVLAMASYPWFDPNRFETANPDTWRNRAVTDTFEPGSVNKTITAAAALDTASVSPHRRFEVPASVAVGTYTIHDSHPHPVERMTLGDIIAASSNVGATIVASHVGSVRLASYLGRFGYGQPTGVGFPGEAAGVVPPLSQWTDVTRATVSYGQGVSVTPLQMAAVYSTIANGGVWVQPRLIRGTQGPDGAFNPAPPSPTRRVVRPETAAMVTRMLAYVVADGTGVNAQIPGYQVAGKTGTARKVDEAGHYVDRYMASFVGFLPAAAPKLVIAVTIDQPRTVYGGVAAAPVFQEVARYAIQRLGIPAAPPVPLPPHVLRLAP